MAHYCVPAAEGFLDKPIPVLDHGFVMLKDYMGADAAIAEAARVSMAGEGTRPVSDDEALIRYMMAHKHTSPFEMVELKFHCSMPIFVARQWIRHRTASVNEVSGRYSQLPELTYVPEAEQIAFQTPTNKQGRGVQVPDAVASTFRATVAVDASLAFSRYRQFLGTAAVDSYSPFDSNEYCLVQENGGISRELARINLPLSTYTQWYWKIDLHNLLHFLQLRLDAHAQWEIRQYAKAMATIVKVFCPLTWRAFEDYRLNAVTLSAPEIAALGHLVDRFHSGLGPSREGHEARMSKREIEEFRTKLKTLGFGFLNAF